MGGNVERVQPGARVDAAEGTVREADGGDRAEGDVWQAVFEGDCGRPYKYTITMEGRQAGGVVMFKGSADLGPRDGGVYDWIGRADNNEFVGFFTSAAYTGVFNMTRPK